MFFAICFRAMKGWLAGCVAATAVIYAFVWIILAPLLIGDPVALVKVTAWLVLAGLYVFFVTCVLTAFPAAAVIWVSEWFAIRSIWFFGCAGACIGVVSETVFAAWWGPWPTFTFFTCVFVLAGVVSGMVYWRVAGRCASAKELDPPPKLIAHSPLP
jgi:hypothetical protein